MKRILFFLVLPLIGLSQTAGAKPPALSAMAVRPFVDDASPAPAAAPPALDAVPVILAPPAAQVALVGTNPYLTVAVTAADPALTYQWNKNGLPVSGATSADLVFSRVQLADAGSYAVTLTNGSGSVTSSAAALTVVPAASASPPPLPTIPARTYLVTAYGAVADDATDNTAAIQAALNAARNAGGGAVRFPAAAKGYLCGPIVPGNNTNLQIDAGATLKILPYYSGTTSPTPAGYYPLTSTSYANFIECNKVSNFMLSGSGTIDGQGSPWWNAYTADGALPHRPYMFHTTAGSSTVLITGIKVTNSPSFHLAVNADNLTIVGVTVSTLGSNALNTDGIDPSGNHHLIQNCNVATGDDNIVMKPGGSSCSDITIANCVFGIGHGLSIGGQTNSGLNGMTVRNCTFTGTYTGIRMKADATQGGLVQNVSFSDLTMTNVPYPILFYSYYNLIGTAGGVKNGGPSITPAIVNSWNGDGTTVTNSTSNPKTANQPINPLNVKTLSGWTNITINNLQATGATGYSMIWGLPLASYFISNVTLNNVSIAGGAGFELYDAANVQFTGAASVGAYVTCNALAITGQPQGKSVNQGSGTAFTVSAVGASGLTSKAPTYQWYLNGVALTNGTKSDNSTVAGATTATLTLGKLLPAEEGSYTVKVSNSLDVYNTTTNLLVSASSPVSATSQPAPLAVVTPFESWASGYGLPNDGTGAGAAAANPSGDGISNLLKYALGGNPNIVQPTLLPTAVTATVNGNPALVYQFNRNKTAAATVTTSVEYSADLTQWTTAVNAQSGVTITTTTVNSTTDQITVTIPNNGSAKLFARLRATM